MLSMEHDVKPGQVWGLGRKTDPDIWYYLVIDVSVNSLGLVKFVTLSKLRNKIEYGGKTVTDFVSEINRVNSLWHRVL